MIAKATEAQKIATASKAAYPQPDAKEVDRIERIFYALRQQNPEPHTELNYHNHYCLLVAVVLSAQATDKGVNRVTASLFSQADSPEKMLQLGEERLRQAIASIGLYRNKARNIILAAELLIKHHNGKVPATRAELESLPGVGRKTANVILNTLFAKATIAVDTHVFRVAHRLGLAKGKTPLLVENELMTNVPQAYLQHAHHWLILHGRYICIARKPKCQQCPVAAVCPSVNLP